MTRKQYVACEPSLTSSIATRLPGNATKNQIFGFSPPGSSGDIASHLGAKGPAAATRDL